MISLAFHQFASCQLPVCRHGAGSLTKRIIIAIWICEYWMCLCPYVILYMGDTRTRTHTHTHPIHCRESSSRMRHSEYADWVEKYWEWEQFLFFGGKGRKESLVRRLFCRVAQQKHGNTNSRTKPHSDNGVLQALWDSGQWHKSSRRNHGKGAT